MVKETCPLHVTKISHKLTYIKGIKSAGKSKITILRLKEGQS